MGKTTDDLERLAHEVSNDPTAREMDMLLTSGERISIALLCMAIVDQGEAAVSFTGSQAGIVTDTAHRKAKILEIRSDRLREALSGGNVAVVAGFQGVSTDRAITTLGRGGSDTTAVALAAALESYDEMLEMSATGGRVLALRSVEFARNYGVPVHVRSAFTWEMGTWVRQEEPGMEAPIISGVTHDTSEAKVTIFRVPDRPGIAAKLFRALADENVNVDMIEQNVSTDDHTDISFTIPRDELTRTMEIVDKVVVEIDAGGANFDAAIGRVSVIGAGMKTNPGVAAQMFETLANESVNIEMISTSTIRISCVVHEDDVERAVRALHATFELDASAS
jgi:aspartate kinase